MDEEDPALASKREEADYIGGVWIDGEFYAEGTRQSRPQTKEEATYGVFGNFESRNTRSSRIGSASLAKPMQFVGGEMFKSADVADEYKDELESTSQEMDTEAPIMDAEEEDREEKIGLELRREQRLKREKERAEREKSKTIAPKKKRPMQMKADRDFASFQKLSGGLGLRMLKKMGYKGGALGKHGTGIVNPVKTKLRPQQMGLGYGGYREKANMMQTELDDSAVKPEKRKQKVQKRAENNNWKASRKDRSKRVYKTIDELKEEANKRATPELVIDMRGPHVRVTSLDKVADLDEGVQTNDDGWTPTGSASTLPELKWNMDALVEHTESEVHKTLDAAKNAEKTAANLRSQRELISKRIKTQKTQASNLESIIEAIKAAQQQASLESVRKAKDPLKHTRILVEAFETIRNKFPSEFKHYRIERIAFALAVESLSRGLKSWKPLIKSAVPGVVTTIPVALVFRKWDNVLDDGHPQSANYEDLVQQTLMSPLSLALSSTPIREFAEPILLLERIRPALPHRIFHYLLTDVVGPRLKMEVSNWNPTRDRVPVHKWIHPWLDILPKTVLDPLFVLIRTKLCDALRGWKPRDKSALTLIEPWQPVWSRPDMWDFLTRAIIPKLRALCTREGGIPVNPNSENPELFKAIVRWDQVIPHHTLVSLLLNGFFPNWVRALYAWLQAPSKENNKKFKQIAQWYKGWKKLFPQTLLEHPVIEAQLRSGLDMMNAAVTKSPIQPVLEQMAAAFLHHQAALHKEAAEAGETGAGVDAAREAAAQRAAAREAEASRLRAAAVRAAAGASGGVSFKEALEKFAGRIGVEFMPNSKKGSRDGCPVFTFGKCNIYFKGQSIYAFMPRKGGGGEWKAVALEALVAMAK